MHTKQNPKAKASRAGARRMRHGGGVQQLEEQMRLHFVSPPAAAPPVSAFVESAAATEGSGAAEQFQAFGYLSQVGALGGKGSGAVGRFGEDRERNQTLDWEMFSGW